MNMSRGFGTMLTLALVLLAGCGKNPPATGTISGSMWYENTINLPVKIRGTKIYLLPMNVERSRIEDALGRLSKRTHPVAAKATKYLNEHNNDGFHDVVWVWSAFLKSSVAFDNNVDDDAKYKALVEEPDWIPVAESIKIAVAESDIDGKYRFDGVQPGEYNLYSEYQYPLFMILWMHKVTVPPGGSVTQNFHSGNAEVTQSKSPDPEPLFSLSAHLGLNIPEFPSRLN
jgi:hypothetical protein